MRPTWSWLRSSSRHSARLSLCSRLSHWSPISVLLLSELLAQTNGPPWRRVGDACSAGKGRRSQLCSSASVRFRRQMRAPKESTGDVRFVGAARSPCAHFHQVVGLGISRPLLTAISRRGDVDRSRAISYFKKRSGARDEARTRDPYLGKVVT